MPQPLSIEAQSCRNGTPLSNGGNKEQNRLGLSQRTRFTGADSALREFKIDPLFTHSRILRIHAFTHAFTRLDRAPRVKLLPISLSDHFFIRIGINLSVQTNLILNDSNDAAQVRLVLVLSTEAGVIADSTYITLTITESNYHRK